MYFILENLKLNICYESMKNAQGGASLKLFPKRTQLFGSDHLVWCDPPLGFLSSTSLSNALQSHLT